MDDLRENFKLFLKEAVYKKDFALFINNAQLQTKLDILDVKGIVEYTIRSVLLELIKEKADIKTLETIFQFSIDSALQDVAAGNIPVLVLGDLFESSTVIECENYFSFVESRVDTFKMEVFFKACKNHLLRSFNDLLKRLSRSQNTVFCGRILMFLAHIFPLSERSGLNIISEFNLENTTVYDINNDSFSDLVIEKEVKTEKDTKSSIASDKNLYQKFWSVQDFFRNPNTCYNKLNWRQLVICTNDILTVFGSFKSDDATSSKWKQAKLPSAGGSCVYFAKYLTSFKLLELELSDSHFRRYVLVQFLIVFQYLSSPVKFKLESYTLTEEQLSWIKETTKTIYKLLAETPPNGEAFVHDIEKILEREEFWNIWKNDGCPDFKQATDKAQIEERLKKKPKIELHSYSNALASSEYTKLWNAMPNNWEACRSSKRNFVPSLESFFGINSNKSNGQGSILKRKLEDSKFNWKGLRLLSMKSPHFFSVNPSPAKYVGEYIESVVQELAKEKPQCMPDIMTVETEAPEESIDDSPEEFFTAPEEESKEEDQKGNALTKQLVQALSEPLSASWKDLAKQLDFQEDEIEYYELFPTPKDRTEQMLTVWMERDGCMVEFKSALEWLDVLKNVNHLLE